MLVLRFLTMLSIPFVWLWLIPPTSLWYPIIAPLLHTERKVKTPAPKLLVPSILFCMSIPAKTLSPFSGVPTPAPSLQTCSCVCPHWGQLFEGYRGRELWLLSC
jgi:hypothetical protein